MTGENSTGLDFGDRLLVLLNHHEIELNTVNRTWLFAYVDMADLAEKVLQGGAGEDYDYRAGSTSQQITPTRRKKRPTTKKVDRRD